MEPKYSQSFVDVGEGQPVLLLHGLFGKVSMWKDTIEGLKKSFRVIIPRLPLFEQPGENVNVPELAIYLNEFIEWNNLSGIYLVGHGLGGQLALVYASEHPDKVIKVVVSGSALFRSEEVDLILESMLNKVDHRVMLLWGREDKITPPAVTFHFNDFLRNSEIRFIEKCGHLPMVEEPERFVGHLASFFD